MRRNGTLGGQVLHTLPVFLVFWLLMTLILLLLNLSYQEKRLDTAAADVRRYAAADYSEIWAGTAEEGEKPGILTWRLSTLHAMSQCGGVGLARVYDREGRELARGQMAVAALDTGDGTGGYSRFVLFDPVLTDRQQIALARALLTDRTLTDFGFAQGRGDFYGEVTGVAEGNVIYPQRMVLHRGAGDVVLADSDSDFFRGRELTTVQFLRARVDSALTALPGSGPARTLALWREAEGKLDRRLADYTPTPYGSYGASDGTKIGLVSAEQQVLVASSYAYGEARLSMRGMTPTVILTLAAAVCLAVVTARLQERALRRERDFTSAAAHELKTPLAVLRAHAESLREDIAPEKREAYLDVVLDEADRMDALVGDLLHFSRLEAGAQRRLDTPVELSDAVRACADRLSLQAEERGLRLTLDLSPGTVAGERTALERLTDNLLSNALRHCRPGGAIRVRLERRGDDLRLTVENDGDPIPAEDLPRIWEPFYKGDKSRCRDRGGAGLGLALVRQIAALHGGCCEAENLAGGVRFTVTLPACNRRADML